MFISPGIVLPRFTAVHGAWQSSCHSNHHSTINDVHVVVRGSSSLSCAFRKHYCITRASCMLAAAIVIIAGCTPAAAAGSLTISTAGSFNANCVDVYLSAPVAVTVMNPLSLTISSTANSTVTPNVVVTQSNLVSCAAATLTISSNGALGRLSVDFGSSARSIVVSSNSLLYQASSTASITVGSGTLAFTAAPNFYIQGTINIVMNHTDPTITTARVIATSRMNTGTINFYTTGIKYGASIAFLSGVSATFVGAGQLTIANNALWSGSNILLQGVNASTTSDATVITQPQANSVFTMSSSSLVVKRTEFDAGDLRMLPSTVHIILLSSTISISCGAGSSSSRSSFNRTISIGGASTTIFSSSSNTTAQTISATFAGSLWLPNMGADTSFLANYGGITMTSISLNFVTRGSSVNFKNFCDVSGSTRGTLQVTVSVATSDNVPSISATETACDYTMSFATLSMSSLTLRGNTNANITLLSMISSSMLASSTMATSVSFPTLGFVAGGSPLVSSSISFATASATVVTMTFASLTLSSASVVRVVPGVVPSSSTCSGATATNILFSGALSASSLVISGDQLNITLDSSARWTNVGVTITQLGTDSSSTRLSCLPTNVLVNTGATLTSSTFTAKPYSLGSALVQSGALLSSTTISFAPNSAISNAPARVALSPTDASSFNVVATLKGTSDTIFIDLLPSGAPAGRTSATVVGLCSNSQRFVVGPSNDAAISTLQLQRLTIVATNIAPTIIPGTTLVDSSISIAASSCPFLNTFRGVTFAGTSSINIASTTSLTMVGCTFIGPTAALQGSDMSLVNATGIAEASAASRPVIIVTGACTTTDRHVISGELVGVAVAVTQTRSFSITGSITNSQLTHSMSCSIVGVTHNFQAPSLTLSRNASVTLRSTSPGRYSIGSLTAAAASTVAITSSCLGAYCPNASFSVALTITSLQLSSFSLLTFSDSSYYPTSIGIDSASVTGNSAVSITSASGSNSLGGFGTISNSSVTLISTATDLDTQAFASGASLRVDGWSTVVLQAFPGTPSSSCGNCDFSLRPTVWLAGSTLRLDAPRLNVLIGDGTLTDFTLIVTRMRLLKLGGGALIRCNVQLTSGSASLDYLLTTLPSLLVLNSTTMSWAARFVEAILPLIRANTSQVQLNNASNLTLSAAQCVTSSQQAMLFSASGSQLPMPGTTLDVTLPALCTTAVTIDGLTARGSTLRVRSSTTAFLSGNFTSNTTLVVAPLVGATLTYSTLVISDSSSVSLDLRSITGAPALLQQPLTPILVAANSRLEINAANAQSSATWAIAGASVVGGSSLYINVPYTPVMIATLTNAGCSFTIIANTITSLGSAMGNGVEVNLQVTSSSTNALSLTSLSSAFTNVTLTATVGNTALIDRYTAFRMRNANITLLGPSCTTCSTLIVDGSRMASSSVSIRALGRNVQLTNFDIEGNNNAATLVCQAVTSADTSFVDAQLDLTVSAAPTAATFSTRTVLRSSMSVTITVTVTQTSAYQYSLTSNSFAALLLNSVRLINHSSAALTTQYWLGSQKLTALNIPTSDVFPSTLTVSGRNWDSDASFSLEDPRSNVTVNSLGNSSQRRVSVALTCNTVVNLGGLFDFGAAVAIQARNVSLVNITGVHNRSSVELGIRGPSICSVTSREFCLSGISSGSIVNISIAETSVVGSASSCTASLCGPVSSSLVYLGAQRVAIKDDVADSAVAATAERITLSPAVAFISTNVTLTELAPLFATLTLPLRQAYTIQATAQSNLTLRLWVPAGARNFTLAVDALKVATSTAKVEINGPGAAVGSLFLTSAGEGSSIVAGPIASYSASGVFAEGSRVDVASIGGNITLSGIIAARTAHHAIFVAPTLPSVWALTSCNVTTASPITVGLTLSTVGRCHSPVWSFSNDSSASGDSSSKTNAATCGLALVFQGDWSSTTVNVTVPPATLTAIASSSLVIDTVAPASDRSTISVDTVGSLQLLGSWEPGTRASVSNLSTAVLVNATLRGAAIAVEGARGATLNVDLHGAFTDATALSVSELGTFTAMGRTLSALDVPLCSLTAALQRNSSVHIVGLNRRWYPGASGSALLSYLDSLATPSAVAAALPSAQPFLLSLVASPITLAPLVLEADCTLVVLNMSTSMWLAAGLTPLTAIPPTLVLPSLDAAVINPANTSLTFAAVAVRIPVAAAADPTNQASPPMVAVINATVDVHVDAVGAAALGVAAVAAVIANPAAQLNVLNSSFTAAMNTTVSVATLVEAFVATTANTTAAMSGSIAVDGVTFNVATNDTEGSQRQPLGVSLIAVRPHRTVVPIARKWISFNKSYSNASTTCQNTTLTYTPRTNGTTVYNCTTTYATLANLTTIVSPQLNFSALVQRTSASVILGGRPSNNSDGLLRHLTAVDIRNHQTRTIRVLDSTFSLALVVPTNGSVAPQRFLYNAPSSLVLVLNDNVTAYPNNSDISADAWTTTVSVIGVSAVNFSVAAVQLINVNLPGRIIFQQSTFVALSSAVISIDTSAAALLIVQFVPLLSSFGFFNPMVLDVLVESAAVAGRYGLYPLAKLTRVAGVTIDGRNSFSHRAATTLAQSNDFLLQSTPATIIINVQQSFAKGISSLMTSDTSATDGVPLMDFATSALNVINSSVVCSSSGQTSASYGVVVFAPYDAMPATFALSTFQDCVRVISGSTSASSNASVKVGLSWACNTWNQRSLSRSGVRALFTGTAAVYSVPAIESRYGEEICRSDSHSLDVSNTAPTDTSTVDISTTISLSPGATSSISTTSDDSASVSRGSRTTTNSTSATDSASPTASTQSTVSLEITVTAPHTKTSSASSTTTASLSASHTRTATDSSTDSPTISIDPCNTTFRSDSDGFIRNAVVLTDIVDPGSGLHFNQSASTFLTMDRVAFATVKKLVVVINFDTYLRNFYYDVNASWFPLPQVRNCIAGSYTLVNATAFTVALYYDPDTSLSHTVGGDYYCNLTFSTDIFQCQLMTNFTFNFSAAIHVTGTPSILTAAKEEATKLTSAIVTLLSSGAALLQQSRADSLAALSSCQFSLVDSLSLQDSPTQLGFGSEMQFYYRGAVVGNLAVIIGFTAAVFLVASTAALCCRRQVEVYREMTTEERQAAKGAVAAAAALHLHEVGNIATALELHEEEELFLGFEFLPSSELSVDIESQQLFGGSDLLLTGEVCPKTEQLYAPFAEETGEFISLDASDSIARLFSDVEQVQSSASVEALATIAANDDHIVTTSSAGGPQLLGSANDCAIARDDATRPPTPPTSTTTQDHQARATQRPKKKDLARCETRTESVREALMRYFATLAFPSIGALPLLLLADSTTLSSIRLLVHPIDDNDLLIGTVGVVFFLIALFGCGVYVVRFLRRVPVDVALPRHHPLFIKLRDGLKQRKRKLTIKKQLIHYLRYWFLPTTDFSTSRMRDLPKYEMMRVLFEDTKFPLLVCCDLALSLVIAALVGVGISRREVCVYLAGAGAVSYFAFLAFVLATLPNVCRLQLAATIISAALGSLSATLTFASMLSGFILLGTANQYISIVMIGVSMIQFFSTVVTIVVWLRTVSIVLVASKGAFLGWAGLGAHAKPILKYRNDDGDDVSSIDGGAATPLRNPTKLPSSSSSSSSSSASSDVVGSNFVFNKSGKNSSMLTEQQQAENEFGHAIELVALGDASNPQDDLDALYDAFGNRGTAEADKDFVDLLEPSTSSFSFFGNLLLDFGPVNSVEGNDYDKNAVNAHGDDLCGGDGDPASSAPPA